MKDEFYAHSHKEKPTQCWHSLEDHLKSVAEMARTFADDFHAGDWGYLAGFMAPGKIRRQTGEFVNDQ
jgi:CRISPR-associated endonuclease/helicase Cas3